MAARLVVDILSEFNDKGFDQAERRTGRLSGGLSKFGAVAGAAAAGGIAALGVAAFKAVGAASDLQQSMGAIESTFGDATDEIKTFGKNAAQNLGISQSEFSNLAAVSGSMLKNLGYNSREAAKATEDLSQRAADIAATFGGTTADALDAMNAALRGEMDPLERYGIKLSAVDIKQKAMAMGLASATGEVDKHAQAQAAMALIMEQSADKAGTFANEAGTMAGGMQILKAKATDLMAQIGTALLPVVERLIDLFNQYVVPVIEKVAAWLTNLGSSFSGTGEKAGSLQPIIDALKTAWEALWPALQQIWNSIQTNLLPALGRLWEAIKPIVVWVVQQLIPAFLRVAGPVISTLIAAVSRVVDILSRIITAIRTVVNWITRIVQAVGGAFTSVWRGAADAIGRVLGPLQRVIDMGHRAMDAIGGFLKNPLGSIGHAIGGLFGRSASGRAAGRAVGRASAARATSSRYAVTVNGAMMPQETARQIAAIMNGSRVRTGFVGIRP